MECYMAYIYVGLFHQKIRNYCKIELLKQLHHTIFTNMEIHGQNHHCYSYKKCYGTNYSKYSLGNKGIEVWNYLSTMQFREMKFCNSFKTIMKNYFLQLDPLE